MPTVANCLLVGEEAKGWKGLSASAANWTWLMDGQQITLDIASHTSVEALLGIRRGKEAEMRCITDVRSIDRATMLATDAYCAVE